MGTRPHPIFLLLASFAVASLHAQEPAGALAEQDVYREYDPSPIRVAFLGWGTIDKTIALLILVVAILGIVVGVISILHCSKRNPQYFPLMPKLLGYGVVVSVLLALLRLTHGITCSAQTISGYSFSPARDVAYGIAVSLMGSSIGFTVALEYALFFVVSLVLYHRRLSKAHSTDN